MKNKIILLGVGLVGLIILGFYQLFTFSDDKLHIVFCDVGQGDAVFIRTANRVDILIDGGPDDSVLRCLSDNMPFWDRKIDLVFATHMDADHIGGLIEMVKRYQIGSYNISIQDKETAVTEELRRALEEKGIKVREVREGDRFRIKGGEGNSGFRFWPLQFGGQASQNDGKKNDKQEEIVLETLWPQEEFVRERLTDDTNEYSLVQKLTYGETSVLLTGDVDFDILNQIMEQEGSAQGSDSINILKAPHHGSYTGINEDTFLYIKPQFVIISSGKENRYGHPHASVLKELKARNIPYLRTDEFGEIKFVTDGEKIQIITD